MMPSGLADTGATSDLWSYFKSIDHALERAMAIGDRSQLTELDRDRLSALVTLLRETIAQPADLRQVSIDSVRLRHSQTPAYVTDFSLREQLRETPELLSWHAAAKMGFEKKIERLVETLDAYLSGTPDKLFTRGAPEEEFKILRAALATLLRQAASALHA